MDHQFSITNKFETNKPDLSVTIAINGELNANNAIVFEDELKKIFFEQPQNVFLDLMNVTVIVSSAIGTLLLFQDIVTQKGFKFQIVSINEKLKNILIMMGLDNLLVL